MSRNEYQEFSLIADPSNEVDHIITNEWRDDLVVLDNHATYALAGNANNPNIQARIAAVKSGPSGKRLAEQPVGWTRFFEEPVLEAIDVDAIASSALRRLARDPEALTARIAGLSFVRAPANMIAKKEYGIADSIIPPQPSGDALHSCVQLFSPEGITSTSRLTKQALAKGVEPVMSSVNHTGSPEAVDPLMARSFMNGMSSDTIGPRVLAHYYTGATTRPIKPRGSYPIIELKRDRLLITRDGCFGADVLQAVFDDYPIMVASDMKLSKYPESQLQLADLPHDLQKIRGTELRIGILAYLGWSQEQI